MHDWGYYPGDEKVTSVTIPTEQLNQISKKNPFDDRRENNPQGVIDDLVKQTTAQAKTIHELTKKIGEFEKEFNKLKEKLK